MTTLRKTTNWAVKNEEQQVATGVLLVPNRIDSQGDWFEPETIRRIAHDYMRRLQAGEAEQRIMHAVGAGEKVSLVENRVLDGPEEIGDETHETGTWTVSVKVHDSRLWSLFKREVIGGYSIGGDQVEGVEQPPEEVPEHVERSADWPDDAPATRIDDVRITEFSPVDEPAVEPAKVEVLKALNKDHGDALAEGGDACIQALEQRGHDREDAEELCEVMHDDAVKAAGPDESEEGLLARLKSALDLRTTDDAGSSVEDSEEHSLDKVGRTLSQANVAETKAIHDAAATMLEREGHPDHSKTRTYTADPDDEFDMAEHHEKMLRKQDIPVPGTAQLLYPDEQTAAQVAEEMGLDGTHSHTLDGEEFHMPGESHADFRDAVAEMEQGEHDDKEQAANEPAESGADADGKNTDMSNEDTETETETDSEKSADAPEWAESLTEKVEQIEARLDDVEDEGSEKMDDAPEWAQDLAEKVDDLDDRVDKVAKGAAESDQVAGGEETAEKTTEAEAFKAALGGD